MKAIEDFDWTEMWSNAIDGSRWGQKAGMPEFDIGAGPGTTAIPFAKIVKCVTAVETSDGMLARLKENVSRVNLSNITYYANVEIIDANHNMRFPYLDAAVLHYMTWMNVIEDDEERLQLHLAPKENLVEENDTFWFRRKLKTAMISWRKE